MRKILTLIGVLLVLGAVDVSVIAVRAEDEGKPAAKVEGEKKGDAKAEEGGGKDKKPKDVSGGRFAGDPVYVHIAPMTLPVISQSGVEQLVTIRIDIEVTDFDVADDIHTNMPRVMDALMHALYGGLGQGSLRNGKLVDIGKVKAKATTALEEVIGAAGIRDVLIQGVSQRML